MRPRKLIQLPRGYLSYSAKELWKSDREKFAKIYFDGRDELRTSNQAMDYGKLFADALEKGKETGDLLTDAAILLTQKYDIADKEIHTNLKTRHGWIPLLGKPDSLDSKTKDFLEFKTGKTAWNQKKAQAHPQMVFYAMVIYSAFKVLLKGARLIWIETEVTDKGVQPTGKIESFDVTFSLESILQEMAETARVAKEIETAWIAHVPDKRLIW